MATKTFNVSMDEELVRKIDAAAKAQYASRSDYLRTAALKQLQGEKATDTEVMHAAHKIVRKYRSDFKNLADR